MPQIKVCITLDLTLDLKENHMATAEVVVTGSIAAGVPPPPPLTVTPPTFTLNLTNGQALPETVIATVSGGVPPYTYALDPAITNPGTVPNGLALDQNVANTIGISGTPTDPAGTPVNFGVIVTDSAGNTANAAVRRA